MNIDNYYMVEINRVNKISKDSSEKVNVSYIFKEFRCAKTNDEKTYIDVLSGKKYLNEIPKKEGALFIHPNHEKIELGQLLNGRKINIFNFYKVISLVVTNFNREPFIENLSFIEDDSNSPKIKNLK